jgi:hypothetical protein
MSAMRRRAHAVTPPLLSLFTRGHGAAMEYLFNEGREFAMAGGLASYGTSLADAFYLPAQFPRGRRVQS